MARVECPDCGLKYDDTYRRTYCPHPEFKMQTTARNAVGETKVCSSVEELDRFMGRSEPPRGRMDDETYRATQDQIQLYVGLLKGLDLDGFCERLAMAETVGPLLDPTLYRDALQSGKLDLLRGVADALRTAQKKIAKIEAEFRRTEERRG